MTPCMGGWCSLREKCPHYTARQISTPSERICLPGNDGVKLREDLSGHAEFVIVFDEAGKSGR